jgi:hypothetical protein
MTVWIEDPKLSVGGASFIFGRSGKRLQDEGGGGGAKD